MVPQQVESAGRHPDSTGRSHRRATEATRPRQVLNQRVKALNQPLNDPNQAGKPGVPSQRRDPENSPATPIYCTTVRIRHAKRRSASGTPRGQPIR
jgi:hypothetical protein